MEYESRNMDERQLFERLETTTPVIITDLNGRIVGVSRNWVTMCRFDAEEAFGNTPKMLHGPMTNVESALDFSLQIRAGHSCFASILNYKKDGTMFVNHLYGFSLGDLLIAETYSENRIEDVRETVYGSVV